MTDSCAGTKRGGACRNELGGLGVQDKGARILHRARSDNRQSMDSVGMQKSGLAEPLCGLREDNGGVWHHFQGV